jgi:hypothetical protein
VHWLGGQNKKIINTRTVLFFVFQVKKISLKKKLTSYDFIEMDRKSAEMTENDR